MKKEKAEFAARLRSSLRDVDIEASASVLEKLMARHGGPAVTAQAISGWLSGRYMPKQDKIRVLAEIVGVDPHVLQYGGSGSRRVKDNKAQWPEGLSSQDLSIFHAFLALPTAQRKLVRELILVLGDVAKPKAR